MSDETKPVPQVNPKRIACAVVYFLIFLVPFFIGDRVFYLTTTPDSWNVFRYVWCFSSSCLGFAAVAIVHRRVEQSPFPEYAIHYPLQLLAMSAIVVGVLHLSVATSGFVFYYLGFGLSFTLGFLVDSYWTLVSAAVGKNPTV